MVKLAFKTFAARYGDRCNLPDAFIFTDDYRARGALLALLAAGVRTGRDVIVVTLANQGNIPVHPDPIDLMLRNPTGDAEAISMA